MLCINICQMSFFCGALDYYVILKIILVHNILFWDSTELHGSACGSHDSTDCGSTKSPVMKTEYKFREIRVSNFVFATDN